MFTSEFSFLDFRSIPFAGSIELGGVSRAPIFGEFCWLVLACWQNNPSISFQSSSAIGLFWCEFATNVQILFFPINLFDGILFQLMVFIFVFGTGVSCCGNNLPRSTVSGVFGRWVSVKMKFYNKNRWKIEYFSLKVNALTWKSWWWWSWSWIWGVWKRGKMATGKEQWKIIHQFLFKRWFNPF